LRCSSNCQKSSFSASLSSESASHMVLQLCQPWPPPPPPPPLSPPPSGLGLHLLAHPYTRRPRASCALFIHSVPPACIPLRTLNPNNPANFESTSSSSGTLHTSNPQPTSGHHHHHRSHRRRHRSHRHRRRSLRHLHDPAACRRQLSLRAPCPSPRRTA